MGGGGDERLKYFGCTVVFCVLNHRSSQESIFSALIIFSLWPSNIRNAIQS